MISIYIDEKEVRELLLKEIEKRINLLEKDFVFWDMKELCRRTCMSVYSIKVKLFIDPRFPKFRLEGKWYFPAKECEAFLLKWIKEQPRN